MKNQDQKNDDFKIEVLMSSAVRAAAVYNDFFLESGIVKISATEYDIKQELYQDPESGDLFCEFLELLEHSGVEIR